MASLGIFGLSFWALVEWPDYQGAIGLVATICLAVVGGWWEGVMRRRRRGY